MRFGRYGTPYLILRLGLGLTFVWVGIDMFRHPEAWVGFVPTTIPLGLSRQATLQLSALFDIAIGLLFLTNNFARITALVASLHLVGIIAIHGLDAVIVRDVGLLGASLALLFWPHHRRRHWLTRLLSRKRKPSYDGDE